MEVRPPQLHVLCVGAAVLWNVILEKAAPAVLEPFASPNSRRRGNMQTRKLERKRICIRFRRFHGAFQYGQLHVGQRRFVYFRVQRALCLAQQLGLQLSKRKPCRNIPGLLGQPFMQPFALFLRRIACEQRRIVLDLETLFYSRLVGVAVRGMRFRNCLFRHLHILFCRLRIGASCHALAWLAHLWQGRALSVRTALGPRHMPARAVLRRICIAMPVHDKQIIPLVRCLLILLVPVAVPMTLVSFFAVFVAFSTTFMALVVVSLASMTNVPFAFLSPPLPPFLSLLALALHRLRPERPKARHTVRHGGGGVLTSHAVRAR